MTSMKPLNKTFPSEELKEVAGETEVWASPPTLLPPEVVVVDGWMDGWIDTLSGGTSISSTRFKGKKKPR